MQTNKFECYYVYYFKKRNMQYDYYEKLMDLNVLYDAFQKCKSGVDWKCSI
nr:MAG TPA: hypothetical protein [Caudoviricetes sp.]